MLHPSLIPILYMEDDPGLALLLKRRLEKYAFYVDIAHDGIQGLKLYASGHYQLVILDQNMPIYSGMQVLQAFASQGAVPPTIMLTGTGDEAVAVEAMKLGARDYVVKDAEGTYLEFLPVVVRQVLDDQQWRIEREQAAETLRHSEERYRTLVELSPDAIIVHEQGTISYVNQGAVTLLGAAGANQLIGCLLQSILVEDYRSIPNARLEAIESVRLELSTVEQKLRCLDGTIIDVEVTAAEIPLGQTRAVQMIVRDVRERNAVEQARRESDRLRVELDKERELGDLKTELMTMVSHEFRTPLTIIHTASELLCDYYDRMTVVQRTERLKVIQSQAQKLGRMIHDVSQAMESQIAPRRLFVEAVDMHGFVQQLAIEQGALFNNAYPINCQVAPELTCVRVDRTCLERVLTNLLTNAMKYSMPGQSVLLEVFRADAALLFRVSDAGIGISVEDQKQLFNHFYRGANVGNISGTGIGMAIVRDAVTLHGGSCSIESNVGKGTTVTVSLPYEPCGEAS